MPAKIVKKKVVKKKVVAKKKAKPILVNLSGVAPTRKKVEPTKRYSTPKDTLALYRNSWFLIISFRKPGNFRKIRQEDVEVLVKGKSDVDQTMLRVEKQLLDSPELEEISKFDGRCRVLVKKFTLKSAFDGTGIYLVPRSLAEQAREFLKEQQKEREVLVGEFMKMYPSRIEEAKERLIEFFDAARYDSPTAVQNKFHMTWCLRTIDMARDIGTLGEEVEKEERKLFHDELRDLHTDISSSLRAGFKLAINRFIYALTPAPDGKGGLKRRRLETSNVQHLMEFLDFFAAKNIVDDTDCAKLVEQAKAMLAGKGIKDLMSDLGEKEKGSPTNDFREQMLVKFTKIAEQADDLVIEDESRMLLV